MPLTTTAPNPHIASGRVHFITRRRRCRGQRYGGGGVVVYFTLIVTSEFTVTSNRMYGGFT